MLHDALRVSDGTREKDEIENGSKAKNLSMAVSGMSLARCTSSAASSYSFYALMKSGIPFSLQTLEMGGNNSLYGINLQLSVAKDSQFVAI